MCLTITGFKTREEARQYTKNPLVAKKDIKVYKNIKKTEEENIFRNCYYGGGIPRIEYVKGWEYYQEGDRKFSFSVRNAWWSSEWCVDINRGLHSSVSASDAEIHSAGYSDVVYEFIIPKAALYFKNGGEYVSDRLIFPKNSKQI